MHKKIAKNENTMLGIQDNSILTDTMFMEYGRTGQGVGG